MSQLLLPLIRMLRMLNEWKESFVLVEPKCFCCISFCYDLSCFRSCIFLFAKSTHAMHKWIRALFLSYNSLLNACGNKSNRRRSSERRFAASPFCTTSSFSSPLHKSAHFFGSGWRTSVHTYVGNATCKILMTFSLFREYRTSPQGMHTFCLYLIGNPLPRRCWHSELDMALGRFGEDLHLIRTILPETSGLKSNFCLLGFGTHLFEQIPLLVSVVNSP